MGSMHQAQEPQSVYVYGFKKPKSPRHKRMSMGTVAALMVLLILMMAVTMCYFHTTSEAGHNAVYLKEDSSIMRHFNRPLLDDAKTLTQLSFNMPYESAWRQHAHLVVFGVLATDKPERQEMRNNQRSTWLRYPDVATRLNAFKGLMLVLYAACPHVNKGHAGVPKVLSEEMHTHHDVLLLRMKEEAPTVNKIVGQESIYDLGADVSMTRKTLLYMLYVYNTFPNSPFIAKGDDDSYVYVSEYLRMLRQLPRINTIYGAVTKDKQDYADHPRRTALGMGYTVTRDILREAVSEPTVNELLMEPYSSSWTNRYHRAYFHHEDAVIGKALDRLYGSKGSVRALPCAPEEDGRLPAVEGWGRAYMAYIRDPHNVPHTGGAAADDEHDVVIYSFPEPYTLHAGNVLWVNDTERIKDRCLFNVSDFVHGIIANPVMTAEAFNAHWNADDHERVQDDDDNDQHPQRIAFHDETFFTDVSLLGSGFNL